ncbi:hypothetical protein AYI70_g7360 [Smittium culicis]|uniref:Uncharacterized protein n=1 Tax=Smittium culicis TaxID=133412 RepID=A0A1R1XL07_9FUNG|nr:hypothetical protein AYI70_g7360 [Smittium culicis]
MSFLRHSTASQAIIYAIQQEIIKVNQPTQHKPEDQANSNGYENKLSTDEPRDTQGKGKEYDQRSRKTNKEGGNKYTQSCLIPRKSSSYESGSLFLTIDDEKAVRTKKSITFREKRLEHSCKIVDTCFGKFINVETTYRIGMEDFFYQRSQKWNFFTDVSDLNWGIVVGDKHYSGLSKAQQIPLVINVKELLFILIHEETRMKLIQKPIEGIRGPMETLYIDGDEISTELYSIDTKPCGYPVETESANRMFIIEKKFQQDPENFRRTRCGYVCDPKEHTAENFRKLEARQRSYNDKRVQTCMEELEAIPRNDTFHGGRTRFSKRKFGDA